MLEFKVSAPGKVILFGEHSVVYGKTAIASSLNLRTTMSFRELSPEHEFIHVSMPQTKLDKRIDIHKVQCFFFNAACPKHEGDQDNFRKYVEKFVESIKFDNDPQKFGLEAIFYLLISIFQAQNITNLKPFMLHGDTELSISSGLGSSASFSVCIATCFLHYSRLLLKKDTALDDTRLKEVSQYAFDCEKIMHGSPSGIDNSICTFGSIIEFRKNESLNFISCTTGLRIMLVDTKMQRNTKALVEKVRQLKIKYPSVLEPIFDSMGNLAKESLKYIHQIQNSAYDCDPYEELSNLMEINQNLLSAIGVSHPALDTICTEVKKFRLTAKLTGAGGGGYAYVLIPPGTPNNNINNLNNVLSSHGFIVKLTTLGECGVRIH